MEAIVASCIQALWRAVEQLARMLTIRCSDTSDQATRNSSEEVQQWA